PAAPHGPVRHSRTPLLPSSAAAWARGAVAGARDRSAPRWNGLPNADLPIPAATGGPPARTWSGCWRRHASTRTAAGRRPAPRALAAGTGPGAGCRAATGPGPPAGRRHRPVVAGNRAYRARAPALRTGAPVAAR